MAGEPFRLFRGERLHACRSHGFVQHAHPLAGVGVGRHAPFDITSQCRKPTVVDAPKRCVIGRLLSKDLHSPHHPIDGGAVAVVIGQAFVVEIVPAGDCQIDQADLMTHHSFQQIIVVRRTHGQLGRQAPLTQPVGQRWIDHRHARVEHAVRAGDSCHLQAGCAERSSPSSSVGQQVVQQLIDCTRKGLLRARRQSPTARGRFAGHRNRSRCGIGRWANRRRRCAPIASRIVPL